MTGEFHQGQEVRVFPTSMIIDQGAPPGGWPGRIVKVTAKLVDIEYGDRPRRDLFTKDSQRIRHGDIPRMFRTLPQVEEDKRRAAALRAIEAMGFRPGRLISINPRGLNAGQLEQLATLLAEFRQAEQIEARP